MCGRFCIATAAAAEELRTIIDQINRRYSGSPPLKTVGEILPTDTVPVIANDRNLSPAPFAMKWGYTLADGRLLINARSETAAEKRIFRDGMLHRRCLIPASHYYEWEHRGKERVKYAIRPVGTELCYLAGIYRIVGGKPEFSILTRKTADNIAFIHDRMPVILPKDVHSDWLNVRCSGSELLNHAVSEVVFAPFPRSESSNGIKEMLQQS